MFVRVFEYLVSPERVADFERVYGPRGDWATLFTGAQGYLGTTLERGDGPKYRTQDHWHSAGDYERFLRANRRAYDELDRACAALSLSEELCGHFTEPQPPGATWTPVG